MSVQHSAAMDHFARRKAILAAHPCARRLVGPDIRLLPVGLVMVVVQLLVGYQLRTAAWYTVLASAYLVGGTITLITFNVQHETQHRNVFGARWGRLEDALGWLMSAPSLFPYRLGKRQKHLIHHRHLGVAGKDQDRPSEQQLESSRWRSCRLLQLLSKPVLSRWRQLQRPVDAAQTAVLTALVVSLAGPRTAAYLALGPLLGRTLHPFSAALLCSHSYGPGDQALTYSYRGPLNTFFVNSGYHIEHHDFPSVSCLRLPLLTQLAPEFYVGTPEVNSWFTCMVNYITRADGGLSARRDA